MEILNTIERTYMWLEIILVVFMSITLGSIVVMIVFIIDKDLKKTLISLILPVIFIVLLIANPSLPTASVKHEVIIKDGYKIDALKYEVIEQRGKIITIEEK